MGDSDGAGNVGVVVADTASAGTAEDTLTVGLSCAAFTDTEAEGAVTGDAVPEDAAGSATGGCTAVTPFATGAGCAFASCGLPAGG